ncbi:helicase HerA-like domain-containing protein [Legionella worsleiensis]|uniref:Putative ATPase n=1 Tax=Legionella worsleiensis TaxID=45076 RepID=A0A0W1AJV9_9GAMM|nr:helicase HerA-like domain-containing protein [Legionella worsleiensis]KTD81623.1 putative ATPase [Legionella worsleiensis]STY31968.1 putative ATPase [Legionella worsleiensis]
MYDDIRIPYQAGTLPALLLGGIELDHQLIADAPVHLVLKSLNRHGLVAGATGSGKTKTIQVLSEQLSLAGVPSLVMDIKGDISGLAMPGDATESLIARSKSLHLEYTPRGFPVEFLALSESHPGVPLRSTVADFGPVLFARMLDVNETQEGVITVLFEYARQTQLPLIDLADLKSLLQFGQTDAGKKQIEAKFGGVAASSVGTIMRKIIELESQGGDQFFGEPAFDVLDLVRTTPQGLGIISVLRLLDMQDKPKLFSTFMLKLLSDVYKTLPELGDPDKPRLVLFIDEAHLIFSHASKALLSLLDTMVKLIRSKGVGLIFCTQTPNDIPESVLSQLGLKIQHALRAFTAKDRKAMKLVAQNFPPSEHYDTEQLLTALRIGEALVSSLDGKGQPTPLIQCMIRAPESRMGVLTDEELKQHVAASSLYPRYGQRQERHSAKDILMAKSNEANQERSVNSPNNSPDKETSVITSVTKNTLFRQIIRQIVRDMTRALMTALGIKKR